MEDDVQYSNFWLLLYNTIVGIDKSIFETFLVVKISPMLCW